MAKRKRSSVYLQYKCKDGSVTVASTASIGLMYWLGRVTPTKPIENPKPFEIYVVETATPFPYHPRFLSLAVAGVERTLGKAPEIAAQFFEDGFYAKLPKGLSFRDIEEHLKKGTPEIVAYEQACLDMLNWLHEQGEITSMVFDKPIQPLGM